MRFGNLRVFLPQMAFAAAAARVKQWWDDFIAVWNPDERAAWRDAQRSECLDADQIEAGGHTGFAAGSGGDEG